MTICPSCGSKVERDLCVGCPLCGARAIGPPLAKPEHQLAAYGRAVIVFASGVLMLLVFFVSLISTLVQNKGSWIRFSAIVGAGEVTAWGLKWAVLPVAVAVLWSSGRSIRLIKLNPRTLTGLRMARSGFASALFATLLVATLIGITVPERWRRHQWAVEAATTSRIYTINRALLEFKDRYGTLPSEPKDLSRLPDPYGTISDAIANIDLTGYQPNVVVASAATKVKPPSLRGGALRNASFGPNVEPTTDRGVTFTNYEWRLAGPDKVMFTEDDLIVRDGVIMSAAELPRPATTSSQSRQP